MLPNFIIEFGYHVFQVLYKGATSRKSTRNIPYHDDLETSRCHSRIFILKTLGIQFDL